MKSSEGSYGKAFTASQKLIRTPGTTEDQSKKSGFDEGRKLSHLEDAYKKIGLTREEIEERIGNIQKTALAEIKRQAQIEKSAAEASEQAAEKQLQNEEKITAEQKKQAKLSTSPKSDVGTVDERLGKIESRSKSRQQETRAFDSGIAPISERQLEAEKQITDEKKQQQKIEESSDGLQSDLKNQLESLIKIAKHYDKLASRVEEVSQEQEVLSRTGKGLDKLERYGYRLNKSFKNLGNQASNTVRALLKLNQASGEAKTISLESVNANKALRNAYKNLAQGFGLTKENVDELVKALKIKDEVESNADTTEDSNKKELAVEKQITSELEKQAELKKQQDKTVELESSYRKSFTEAQKHLKSDLPDETNANRLGKAEGFEMSKLYQHYKEMGMAREEIEKRIRGIQKRASAEIEKQSEIETNTNEKSEQSAENQLNTEKQITAEQKQQTEFERLQAEYEALSSAESKEQADAQKRERAAAGSGGGAPPSGGGGRPPGGDDDDDDIKKKIAAEEELAEAKKKTHKQEKKNQDTSDKSSDEQKENIESLILLQAGLRKQLEKNANTIFIAEGEDPEKVIDNLRDKTKKLLDVQDEIIKRQKQVIQEDPNRKAAEYAQMAIAHSKKFNQALTQTKNLMKKELGKTIIETEADVIRFAKQWQNIPEALEGASTKLERTRKTAAAAEVKRQREIKAALTERSKQLDGLIKRNETLRQLRASKRQDPAIGAEGNIKQVIGQLRAGTTPTDPNEGLISTEKLLNQYGDLSGAYDKITKDQLRAEKANEKWIDSLEQTPGTLRNLDKEISKINVQFFTYTNILQDAQHGIGEFARGLRQATKFIVEAGARFETFEIGLKVVEGSSLAAKNRLKELLDLSDRLVGIDTTALIKYANQLRAAGVAAADTNMVIEAITKSISEMGKGTVETERVMRQLTQGIGGNKIVLQDLRPIVEEIPRIWRAASQALGVTIKNVEQLREAVSDQGLEPSEGLLLVVKELGKTAKGADLKTYAAQVDILKDRFNRLSAEMGQGLLPIIVYATNKLNEMLESMNQMGTASKHTLGLVMGAFTGISTVFSGSLQGLIGLITAVEVSRIFSQFGTFIKMQRAQIEAGTEAAAIFDKQSLAVSRWSKRLYSGGLIIAGVIGALVLAAVAMEEFGRHSKETARAQEELEHSLKDTYVAIGKVQEAATKSRIREIQDAIIEERKVIDEIHEMLLERARGAELGREINLGDRLFGKTEADRFDTTDFDQLQTLLGAMEYRTKTDLEVSEKKIAEYNKELRILIATSGDTAKSLAVLHDAQHEALKRMSDLTKAGKYESALYLQAKRDFDDHSDAIERISEKTKEAAKESSSLTRQLIELDYTIRRIQDSISEFDPAKNTKEQYRARYKDLQDALDAEKALQEKQETALSDNEEDLKDKLFEINEKYKYDREKLAKELAKALVDHDKYYLDKHQELVKQSNEQLLKYHEERIEKQKKASADYFEYELALLEHYRKAAEHVSGVNIEADPDNLQLHAKQRDLRIKLAEKEAAVNIKKLQDEENLKKDSEKNAKLLALRISAIELEKEITIYNSKKSYTDKVKELDDEAAANREELAKQSNDVMAKAEEERLKKHKEHLDSVAKADKNANTLQGIISDRKIIGVENPLKELEGAGELSGTYYNLIDQYKQYLIDKFAQDVEYTNKTVSIEEGRVSTLLALRIKLQNDLDALEKREADHATKVVTDKLTFIKDALNSLKDAEIEITQSIYAEIIRIAASGTDAQKEYIKHLKNEIELIEKNAKAVIKAEKEKQKAFKATYRLFVNLTTEAIDIYNRFLETGKVTGTGKLIGGIIGAGIGLYTGGPQGALLGWQGGSQIGGELGSLANKAISTETFHSSVNDRIASQEGARVANRATNAREATTVRKNAKDFSEHFGKTMLDNLKSGMSDDNVAAAPSQPVVVQFVLNKKVVQEMGFNLDELSRNNRSKKR